MSSDGGPRAALARGQIGQVYALLLFMNLGAWAAALWLFQGRPVQLGAAAIAYGFGLRHAVDADHIAAIDSATRKLMHQGRRSFDVGLFFSLGHSTIVVLLSFALALAATEVNQHMPALAGLAAAIGTAASILFLVMLAAINLAVFISIHRTYRRVRAGAGYDEDDLDLLLTRRGPLSRLFRGLFRLVGRSWHMYLVGLLFGLGFDTATEIGVLGLSATGATHGVGLWSIMVYPALFTAGMSLVDTSDSVLMTGAYRWALADPIRKLRYNMTITALSATTAVGVAAVEAVGVIGGRLVHRGALEGLVRPIVDRVGGSGWAIAFAFMVCWGASVSLHRVRIRSALRSSRKPETPFARSAAALGGGNHPTGCAGASNPLSVRGGRA